MRIYSLRDNLLLCSLSLTLTHACFFLLCQANFFEKRVDSYRLSGFSGTTGEDTFAIDADF